jgi:TPP-dependent pyruvate/acetoin dehydrogenase alpha subunit
MTDDRLPAETLLGMYEVMARVRACDARLRAGLVDREFAITYWPCSGQEAIAGALWAALRPDDRLVSTYRGLHDQLAKGAALDGVVAEVLARRTGINKGKGGAMHVADPSCGLVLSTGIVGAGIPVGVGVALAAQLRGTDQVTVVSFGDGATGTGAFHEAANLAAVWRLPVVLLCQNNGYAEMTPTAHAQPVEHVADRAAAYAMPADTVDGNDPVATHDALARAVDRARRGDGPSLVECRTYRLHGHYFGDPMAYMPEEELEAARRDHPVDRYKAWLVAHGVDGAVLDGIDGDAAAAVDAAFTAALAAGEPEPEEAMLDVYAAAR